MARILHRPHIKELLFDNSKLQLPGLQCLLLECDNSEQASFKFSQVQRTDGFPDHIEISLTNDSEGSSFQLTPDYGGLFEEKRIITARISRFQLPMGMQYGKEVPVDVPKYEGDGFLPDVLNYLVPRRESPWRNAMRDSLPKDKEETLLTALVEACKAPDEEWLVSWGQDGHCRALLERCPSDARDYLS